MIGFVKPLAKHQQREWVACKKCSKMYYFDYTPYSLSAPIMCLPCGHGLTERFCDGVVYLSSATVLAALAQEVTRLKAL